MCQPKCKYWIDCGKKGHGDCAIHVRTRPSHKFCNTTCRRYHEEGLSPRERSKKEVSLGKQFIKAHNELLAQGRVIRIIAEHRLTVCTGRDTNNKKVDAPCKHYRNERKTRGDGYCGSCGCKDWKISQMKRKVYYPMACPIGRFAAMPGRRVKNADSSSSRTQSEIRSA